jgi:hypothetical protein
MSVHRFPRWLTGEKFTIKHNPAFPRRWIVSLVDGRASYTGYGDSISLAARHAICCRAVALAAAHSEIAHSLNRSTSR